MGAYQRGVWPVVVWAWNGKLICKLFLISCFRISHCTDLPSVVSFALAANPFSMRNMEGHISSLRKTCVRCDFVCLMQFSDIRCISCFQVALQKFSDSQAEFYEGFAESQRQCFFI